MTRNGVRLALFSVGEMGHWSILLRLSAVLRNAVVMCSPLITPDHCWHNTTWPAFQPSLPPGHAGEPAGGGGVAGEPSDRARGARRAGQQETASGRAAR